MYAPESESDYVGKARVGIIWELLRVKDCICTAPVLVVMYAGDTGCGLMWWEQAKVAPKVLTYN